jgi:hypothetical protein
MAKALQRRYKHLKWFVSLVCKKEICYFCEKPLNTKMKFFGNLNITVHHLRGKREGGKSLVYAHSDCHKSYHMSKLHKQGKMKREAKSFAII